jgi:hypothetical protein
VLFLISCDKPLPELSGIDMKAWRDDKAACNAYRTSAIESIRTEKEKLLALTEMQVVELLGRPDENELYKRNQKFFYYYLQPSAQCGSGDGKESLRLIVRFNAVGLAKEVSVE